MFSISEDAVRIVKEKILPYVEQLNCTRTVLKNGATVVDMGIEAPGGWLAAKLFIDATIAGLGHVDFGRFQCGKYDLPSIDVYIDHPQVASLSSQFSSWPMTMKDIPGYIRPFGSGPARAIAQNDPYVKVWNYVDTHHETVFGFQADVLPDESLADEIAQACHIAPENVYILAAKTGSIAGSVQVCSRTIETSVWRLHTKGFDIRKVICGMGSSPIAPPVKDEFKAMVRVNVAVLYGGIVRYIVDCTDAEIEAVIDQLPTCSAKRYGYPFAQMLEEGGRDIFKTDKDIHGVAVFEIMNYATGSVFKAGEIREEYLQELYY
ncbi:MAG: methenyltetrahydromethanopterin cyclohydrolase [Anaerolineae bacterium]|nr:methenyltetrahydromethanopterin cyclohydrolase [Anaerolineae bacterium]